MGLTSAVGAATPEGSRVWEGWGWKTRPRRGTREAPEQPGPEERFSGRIRGVCGDHTPAASHRMGADGWGICSKKHWNSRVCFLIRNLKGTFLNERFI